MLKKLDLDKASPEWLKIEANYENFAHKIENKIRAFFKWPLKELSETMQCDDNYIHFNIKKKKGEEITSECTHNIPVGKVTDIIFASGKKGILARIGQILFLLSTLFFICFEFQHQIRWPWCYDCRYGKAGEEQTLHFYASDLFLDIFFIATLFCIVVSIIKLFTKKTLPSKSWIVYPAMFVSGILTCFVSGDDPLNLIIAASFWAFVGCTISIKQLNNVLVMGVKNHGRAITSIFFDIPNSDQANRDKLVKATELLKEKVLKNTRG